MALASRKNQIKKERQAVYFDIICGVISAVISLSGIIIVAVLNRVTSIGWFITSFAFLICYLLFSVLLISYGLYTRYNEKHFDENKYKKDLRAPIV